MKFGIFCTFDLKGATRNEYDEFYADLNGQMGFTKVHVNNNAVVPTTFVGGTFEGASASTAADGALAKVQAILAARGLKSEIFIVSCPAGSSWSAGTT